MFITIIRDFAYGLSRGFSLYFGERHDFTAVALAPGLTKTGKRK
jgi:hypothetical protein